MIILVRCPACDRYTQHIQVRECTGPKEQEAHYYTCTRCTRTRRICSQEKDELEYTAIRRYLA